MAATDLGSAEAFYFNATPPRILVVTSDVTLADDLCVTFEAKGYEVAVGTSGQYALMLAAEFEADIIILDTALEGTTSSDVSQILRSAPHLSAHYRRIPVLYLAQQETLINQRFHLHPNTPISDYIFKPIDKEQLLDRVRRTLEETLPSA